MRPTALLAAVPIAVFVLVASAGGCSSNDGGTPDAPDAGDGGDAADAKPTSDARADARPTPEGGPADGGDAGSDALPEADVDLPDADGGHDADAYVVPSHCMDLSGGYLRGNDFLTLTRASCSSLTWQRRDTSHQTPDTTHVYTTDGVARTVTDEQGKTITEEARVDDTTMYVHRTAAGLDVQQTVRWSKAPCGIANPSGIYLVRETTGTATACEYWSWLSDCSAGTAECDLNPATKCETNTSSDDANCGACGQTCVAGPHSSTPGCTSGSCTITCDQGYENCNGSWADGCEAEPAVDTRNCGGCGVECNATNATKASCSSGACQMTCKAGFDDCNAVGSDGCEANLTTSGKTCGSCGNDCKGGVCAQSQCTVRGTTLAKLGANPQFIAVDAANLYFVSADLSGGAGDTLYALDKVNGGTPRAIGTDVESSLVQVAVAGDGSVYFAHASSNKIERWVGGASPTNQVIADEPNAVQGLRADAAGAVWLTTLGTQVTLVRAWAPGDAAAHDVDDHLVEKDRSHLVAIDATSAYVQEPTLATQSSKIYGVPRATGGPVLLGTVPWAYLTQGIVAGSTLYLDGELGEIDTLPIAGGALATWVSGIRGYMATDGKALFAAEPFDTYYSQVMAFAETAAPTPAPVAFAALPQSLAPTLAVDSAAVYVFDLAASELRRVPR